MNSIIEVIYNDGENNIYIEPIVKSVRVSGDIKQCSRKLEVTLSNTLDGRTRLIDIQEGRQVSFRSNNAEVFRGRIFEHEINKSGNHTFTCYDDNVYLSKNEDTRIFRNRRADEIVVQLCKDYGIPYGRIDSTGYVIPKLIVKEKTLFEVITMALTLTKKQSGRKFIVRSVQGKLELIERKTEVYAWVIGEGNLEDANYKRSIDDMRTQVRVKSNETKGKSPIDVVARDQSLVDQFGLMQKIERIDGDTTAAQARELAKELVKQLAVISDEASITALGIDGIISGSCVYAKEEMTGIIGGFYVQTDAHSYEGGIHKMELTLSATDELPTLEYEEDSDEKEGTK